MIMPEANWNDEQVRSLTRRIGIRFSPVLGDSITEGWIDAQLRPGEAWPSLLDSMLAAGNTHSRSYNAGRGGDTTDDALLRIDPATPLPRSQALAIAERQLRREDVRRLRTLLTGGPRQRSNVLFVLLDALRAETGCRIARMSGSASSNGQ